MAFIPTQPTYGNILAQSVGTASTLVDVYTVPGGKSAYITGILVSNSYTAANNVKVSIAPAGAATNDKHYILGNGSNVYAQPGGEHLVLSYNIILAATDVIRFYNTSVTTGNIIIFGIEV